MAVGDPAYAGPECLGRGFVALGASASPWTTVITAAGVATADNSGTVTNPALHITLSSRLPFRRNSHGPATLQVRLGYDDGATPSQQLKIVVWGRKQTAGNTEAFQRLYNKEPSPATEVEVTTASTTDAEDGTLKYTEVDPRKHAWDVAGCDEFYFQVSQAFNATGGNTTTNAILQAKLV